MQSINSRAVNSFLYYIYVVYCIVLPINIQNPDFLEVLTKQLHATVATAMEKYADKK